ncbi:histidinol-phosphatase HisJ [Planococcus sp. 1R117A]|uniref:histidinol-phosphatase HisJ n=1 Tax=Planococcus sp. 1R117A TaxID=3447020 RepID=UPI003EDC7B21
MKRDGHIHTPFCPHGTKDKLNAYIEKAIESGFGDISFTEHAPLPSSFIDPTPEKDSGMNLENMLPYLDAIRQAKDAYKHDILIRVGLEVDYIVGYETETRSFLEEYGPSLDDSILSVHFLRVNDEYLCMDYSSEVFMALAQKAGSVQNVYDLYYDTVEASIAAQLGQFKPKRIGHPTLVHKFQLAHGEKIDDSRRIQGVFEKIAEAGYEMDLNGAGFSKPDCLESYPPANFIPVAESLRIPLVFGSDAHSVNGLHKHYDKLYN